MAVSKTDFINYSRCPRYIVLDKVKKDRLDADIDISEYKKQEKDSEKIITVSYTVNKGFSQRKVLGILC